jgi:hypothetical protein
MSEMSLTVTSSPEVDSLISRVKDIEAKISANQNTLTRKTEFLLCPICQNGYLYPTERGKVLGLIGDKWLICNKCSAEFDKKLSKAQLVKSVNDPYGIYKKYANQTLPLEKWQEIAFSRMRAENYDFEEELSTIKTKLGQFVSQQFIDGKFKLLLVDLNSFILKKDENPLFATKAEVIEERKRKVTQRTTTGGGRRNYSGFSFRVAKGLYYHTGASAPASPRQTTVQSSEYTELVAADSGDFLVTNQRILFKGNRSRGLAIPINKLAAIDIDPDENALMIIQENKKPAILKLLTTFQTKISDIEVSFSINLDHIVSIIKPS